MSKTKEIANRFREVILNGKWVANTNYKDQLQDISWEKATQKVGSLNSLAALVFHINYYVDGILNVFNGGDLEIRDKYSFDLPPIKSEEEWKQLLNTLLDNAEKFAQAVEAMPDEKLEEGFVDPKYGTYSRNIEGMIEHCYYHLGQVSLINKLLTDKEV